ncbi:MAG: flagellar hook-basal body complex protein FliE [Lachnoclostridium sp.]|jgi:flagellar hook-basal body complex protein FliE|nr:flagellar hook-basal body complex protein FliE [Lachnoclostridium sp.]
MNISAIDFEKQFTEGVTEALKKTDTTKDEFDTVFQSAVNMVKETNQLSNIAEEQEMLFATGQSDSIHELQVAQQKANVSLQYTVAVKNTIVEAYKSIMNLQF